MRNKWIKRFSPLIAMLLLAPWPVAYTYDYNKDITGQDTVQMEVAKARRQENLRQETEKVNSAII